jgi:hypothetical protein
MTHSARALSARWGHHIAMQENEPRGAAITLRWLSQVLGHWPLALAIVAPIVVGYGEFVVIQKLLHARTALHHGTSTGCPDECFGAIQAVLFWGAAVFAWPIMGLICVGVIWEAVSWLMERNRRTRE